MPRAGLDNAAVVRAGAALADAEGLGALTLARLAEHLGVRPPSLYNHVAGQAGLQRDLALLGVRELTARMGRAVAGRSGDLAVLALAEAYRSFVRSRPGLYAATVRAPGPDDAELRAASEATIELVGAVLAPYGLRDEDTIHAVRGLRAIVHGFATIETAGGFGLPVDHDELFRRLVLAFAGGLRQRTVHCGSGEEPART